LAGLDGSGEHSAMNAFRLSVALIVPTLLAAADARAQDNGTPPPPPPTNTTTTPPPTNTASTAPVAKAPESSGQQEHGFVFETHMFAQLVTVGIGAGGTAALPLIAGGIYAGYKLDRLMIGLGFNFTSVDNGGAQITMTWTPGIRYAFVRSADDRVELFGMFDIGFGHDFGLPVSNEIIPADLGIGARYWVHKQFAVAAAGGWNGEWLLTQPPAPLPGTSTVTQGIFAGIQVIGVF
jgi:hypothetical protein